jgi:hypothetical protein
MARPGLDKNVKFRSLCRMLGEPRPHVRGYLEYLWEVAYENGDPVIGDADAVESAAEYPGKPGEFCRCLLECGGFGRAGFIEETPGRAGIFQIHDLFENAPRYVQVRKQREQERREYNAVPTARAQRRSVAHNGASPAPAPNTLLGEVSPKNPSCRLASTGAPSAQEFLDRWNSVSQFCHARELTAKRLRWFKARTHDTEWVNHWQQALDTAARLPFCRGENDRGWRATIDWFLRQDTVTKILEGVYDKTNGGAPHGESQRSAGNHAGGHLGSASRVGTSDGKRAAIEDKTIRIGTPAS